MKLSFKEWIAAILFGMIHIAAVVGFLYLLVGVLRS
jgi:hypothetical protein